MEGTKNIRTGRYMVNSSTTGMSATTLATDESWWGGNYNAKDVRMTQKQKQGQALIKNLPKGFGLGCPERYLTIRKTASKQSFNTFIARIDAYLETQAHQTQSMLC